MTMNSSPEKLAGIKKHLRQTFDFANRSVEEIRAGEAAALAALPRSGDILTEETAVGAMHAEWVDGTAGMGTDAGVILIFHGGAFISGSCGTHRELAGRISRESGVRALIVEYRLAPEHTYPAANEDCLFAYRWLLGQGYAPEQIVLGGDSVGGTLALMTLLAIRDSGLARPAGAFLLSPHTDLIRFDSETYTTHAELDPTGSLQGSQLCGEYYAGGLHPRPADLSPLHSDLSGLPGLLIQVGDQEVLLGECIRFAEKARLAGTPVELEVWEHMWCVFQQLAAILPEGAEAIRHIGGFVRRTLQPV